MMDGNPGPVKDEQTEETTEQSTTDYSCVKGFIAGVIVTLVIVFLALQFNSTNVDQCLRTTISPFMRAGTKEAMTILSLRSDSIGATASMTSFSTSLSGMPHVHAVAIFVL